MGAWIKQKKWACLLGWMVLIGAGIFFFRPNTPVNPHFVARAETRSFDIDVRTVGVLEAKHSLVVYSSIPGDKGKIIDLVSDGKQVEKDEVIVTLDPNPFELKLAEIEGKIREQKAAIAACKNALEMEKNKTVLELHTAKYEMKNAQIEYDKTVRGDGPMEKAKLKCALDKAESRYDDFKAYEEDLDRLAEKGFLNPGEKKQALQKLNEAKETYEEAKGQYENFVEHIYPLQVQKAEVAIKKARLKFDETKASAHYRVTKAEETLMQHVLGMEYLQGQRNEALKELELTKIRAPAPGMAVLREEYRSGERRRPRVGDLALKNQPLLNLPDMSTVLVKTKVREVDLHKVAVGKSASIELDAYPDMQLRGQVVSIGVLALSDRSDKVFEVLVQLSESHPNLRPGMTARVTIHSESVTDQLTVPLHAIFTRKTEPYCYRKSIGGFLATPVTIGSHNENWAVVLNGLSEGDQIALVNPEFWR